MVIVGGGFRMDEYPVHIGAFQLEPIFQCCDHLMNTLHGHLVGQCAMA